MSSVKRTVVVVGKSMLSSLRMQPHRGVSRPVDILYLGVLTAEHFPLQLELPDIGDKRRVQREREREILQKEKNHRETRFRATSWPNLQVWQPTGTPKVSLQLKLEFRLDDVGGSSDGTNLSAVSESEIVKQQKDRLLRAPKKRLMKWCEMLGLFIFFVNLLHSICLLLICFREEMAGSQLGLTRCHGSLEPDGHPFTNGWLAIGWCLPNLYIGNGWK